MEQIRILDAVIDEDGTLGVGAISLVNQPAIEKDFVALSAKRVEMQKFDEERMIVYGPVLIPEQLIYREDEQGIPFYIRYSADVIRQSAYQFLKSNNQHNHSVEHSGSMIEGVTVVESWLKEGEQDKSVQLGIDVPVGSWLVGSKVDNMEVWQKIKSGELKGFSIEGYFCFENSDQTANLLEEINQALKEFGI